MIQSFWTDRSEQTVQTQIRLLLEELSDQDLHYLQYCLHLLDPLKPLFTSFRLITANFSGVRKFKNLTVNTTYTGALFFQIRVVNAFQMDLDSIAGMDSYDKRSRPSVISLQSLQAAQKMGGVSRKPNLPSSPEREEPPPHPWSLGRVKRQESEGIPYADESNE